MRPDTSNGSYLWDMLDSARAIREFVQNRTYDDYTHDRMLRSAVERNIEIIGEAAKSISKIYRDCHPEIQWSKIIAQRHVIAHEYGEIKQERIWVVATVHISDLILKIEQLVPTPPI